MSPKPFVPKTAVLGAAGFLGRYLLSFYRSAHPDAVGTDVEGRLGLPRLDLAKPDLRGLRLAETGHTHAVIAAAVARPERMERALDYSRGRNVRGTLELARRLADAGVTPIFISTDYVFDGKKGGYTESSPLHPLNEYGRQKAEVERRLPEATQGRVLILRPGKLFGWRKGDGTLLDEMAARLSCGQPVRAASDQIFCPTYVGDFMAAMAALQAAGATGLFNACSPETWSRLDLARAVAKAVKADPKLVVPIKLADLGEPFERPKNTSLKCSKLRKTVSVPFTPMARSVQTVAAAHLRPVKGAPGWRALNEEVYFPAGPLASISKGDLAFLKRQAAENHRRRARLCGHRSVEDEVHDMVVALAGNAYVHPHKHLRKIESYHIIEGRADFIRFDDSGRVIDVLPLGDRSSGRSFYLRDAGASFHTLLLRSKTLVFHETTRGPFRAAETVFATWAPDEPRREAVARFMRKLQSDVAAFSRGRKGVRP